MTDYPTNPSFSVRASMDNDAIEIPATWWHIALMFAASFALALVGGSVTYTLMFKLG